VALNIAGEIEKEYGEVSFNNPVILFGFNSIVVTEKISLNQKISLVISLLAGFSLLFFTNPPLIIAAFFIVVWAISLLGYSYRFFDTITIDFNHKKIRLNNKFSFVDSIRKNIRKTTVLTFNEVSHFETASGRFSFIYERNSRLVIKSFDHPPLTIAAFRFERDARRLGELLQYHITGKSRTLLV